MKISQWLGYNEDASQYLLRPGELRILNNLQSRRPGMLIARKGLTKIYGRYDNESIFGLYRRATPLGSPSDFLWLQKARVLRDLDIGQLDAREDKYKFVWNIRRVDEFESRIIDSFDVGAVNNFCIAEDRHGRMFIVYGHGIRPRLYRPDNLANTALTMGLDAPTASPSVSVDGTGYFIEGVDVQSGGGAYYEPPELTIEGEADRPARLKAIVQAGNVVGVDIIDGGAGYKRPPTIAASLDKIGTGFRARGVVGNGAREIVGFQDNAAGVVTGTAATTDQTYGTTNGVDGNEILYKDSAGAIQAVPAEYNSDTRRFTALVPVNSASVKGKGAKALLEFSPKPYGFGLNTDSTLCATVNNVNFMKYRRWIYANATSRSKDGNFSDYLYGDFWEGSDYDFQNSAENSLYGGLQASGRRFRLGYSGSVNGRRADVYWPDYSAISVWFCTGTYSGSVNQWTRADVAVGENNELIVTLRPTAQGKTVKSLGKSAITTQYQEFEELPDAVAPVVRFSLTDCPDSWLTGESQAFPTAVKEARQNRLAWFGGGLARPVVGLASVGQAITAASVTIDDPGSGWAKNTTFALRFYQANPYAQITDYNTAVSEEFWGAGHQPYNYGNQYVDFVFTANAPDDQTPHGPPQELVSPAVIAVPGDGYAVTVVGNQIIGDTGTVRLLRRGLDQTKESAVDAQLIQWTTERLDTVTSGNVGSITSISILNQGRNYFAPPTIEVRGGAAGYGLSVEPTITNGRITAVQILDPGLGYTLNPELSTAARAAKVTPIMRPQLRGKYRCAYRYIDRSETVINTITATLGDSSTTLVLSDAVGVEAEMVLDAEQLPHNARIKSVNGNTVEINQETSGLNNATYTGTLGIAQSQGITTVTIALASASGVTVGQHVVGGGFPTGTTVSSINGTTVTVTQAPPEASDGDSVSVVIQHQVAVRVRDLTKPIAYSDFSPIADVDAGPNEERTHAAEIKWSLPGATPSRRADRVELWRTSADQSLVFYRVEAYGVPSDNGVEIVGTDTLTDEELFDPDRAYYAAMPVVLPNGNLNAYRFGKPRDDMSVGVAFQDRLWVGVSTSGEGVNTLYYSEFDEFESLPDLNELPIQQNQKSTDVLTALVPFGSMLLAMQHTHTYAISYNSDPAIDASIQMMSHRGCLHQRCWDIHENVLYSADESGVYAMARNGEVQDISLPIRDYFVSELIAFSRRETFFLQADPRTHILRFFCSLKSNPTDTPSIAMCFDIQAKTWWTESYPNSVTAACTGRPGDARINTILLGAVDGNMYEIAGDSDHANDALTDSFVLDGGSGYREAPEITVPNVEGAVVRGVVSEGRLVDVIIQNPGWNASWGIGLLTEGGNPIATHDGKDIKGVEYDAIKLDIGPPEPGGIQADAYCNWSVTPLIRRNSTVAQGESFVRLLPARITAFEPDNEEILATESLLDLLAEDGRPIRIVPPAVEIGMEAVGDFIPLNSLVSKIDGRDIYLSHPDGTPVSLLAGEPRTNQAGTTEDFLELGGTPMEAKFYKPYRTHVPFRMATGFMQLVNDDVAKGGDALVDRSVSLVYTPTAANKDVEIIERFNGREEMRPNVMRRDRGGPGGFYHRQDSASTVLNTSRNASHLGFATGVAKAKFASRASADMTGEDQHLQIELYARPEQASPWERLNFWNTDPNIKAPQPFVLHSMTVNGVVTDAE